MKKIIGEYKRFENLENYHAPEFNSNASEFHVTMWNLKYGIKDVVKEKKPASCGNASTFVVDLKYFRLP